MADRIRVGIVGATVTQGGSGWGATHVPALRRHVGPSPAGIQQRDDERPQ